MTPPGPRTPYLLLLVVGAASSCVTWPGRGRPADEQARIEALEDMRSLGGGVLQALTGPGSPLETRVRALLALARLQDPLAAAELMAALIDPEPRVREWAAFAAGQLGLSWTPLEEPVRQRLADAVLAAEAEESVPAARDAELEALGRLRSPAALERLARRLEPGAPTAARAALALGVGVRAGGATPSGGLERLAALSLPAQPREVRFAAGWALAQLKAPAAVPALVACAGDLDPEVQAACAKGLGEHGGPGAVPALRALVEGADARAAAEAVRTLARLAGRCELPRCEALAALEGVSRWARQLLAGDGGGASQPLLALAQAPLPDLSAPLLKRLRLELRPGLTAPSPLARAAAANLDCRLAAAQDRQAGALREVRECGGGQVPEARRLALGLKELAATKAREPAARVAQLAPLLTSEAGQVRLAAVEALDAAGSPDAIPFLEPLLQAPDAVLAAAAAGALAHLGAGRAVEAIRALARREAGNVDVAPALAEALATLKDPAAAPELRVWLAHPNATVRAAAAAALGALTGAPVQAPRVEQPPRLPAPATLPAAARLRLELARGTVVISLLTADAPRTAANLASLARQGYLDGLTFHRVVPDFVVQGGDPRGDGEGGPGYSIRCEVNRRPYRRGAVGMALAGKDTGGSQFFLTLAPQPYLEGRYTVFGEVVEGLDLVDDVLEGEVIVRATVTP